MRAVVTVGNFDGVHLGHRALVDRAREIAAGDLAVTAMFFDPHPVAFFQPEATPPLLTSIDRRRALLAHVGVDRVDVREFDEAFSRQSARSFVADVLAGDANAAAVVVGPDFRFGQGREGDLARLEALGAEHGMQVVAVPPVEHRGEVVSSTRVRQAVAEGDVESAAALMARYHDLRGEVVHGDHRGRTIDVPTANLAIDAGGAVPADGVYAVITRVDGSLRAGVANVGVRPTFEAGRSVEVHLLDYRGDLYGAELPIAFIARLRGEQRFDGFEALVTQIGRDIERARGTLAPVLDPAHATNGGPAVLPAADGATTRGEQPW